MLLLQHNYLSLVVCIVVAEGPSGTGYLGTRSKFHTTDVHHGIHHPEHGTDVIEDKFVFVDLQYA